MTGTNQFDPVYPPYFRNDGTDCPTFSGASSVYMGDYDRAFSDNNYVHYTWGDNRNRYTNLVSGIARNQADVRFIRLSWPH